MFHSVLIPCLGLVLPPLDLPKLFVQQSFNSRDLAVALNYFVAMGEERTAKKIGYLANDFLKDWKRDQETHFSLNSRLSWMCRILYEPKDNDPLRPPLFGALLLPTLTMPLKQWPHYPLVLSGETFFVLGDGYHLHGRPESMLGYLKYCQTEGVFRKKPIVVSGKEQALKDFTLLTESDRWKSIKWKDSGVGRNYSFPKQIYLSVLKSQAEDILVK